MNAHTTFAVGGAGSGDRHHCRRSAWPAALGISVSEMPVGRCSKRSTDAADGVVLLERTDFFWAVAG